MTRPRPSASTSRPFAAAPDVNRYFPSAAMEEARLRVVRSVQRGEGPVLVIGAAGLGKTLLLEVLATQLKAGMQAVTLLGGQLCTRRALLQMMLFQLGLPYRDMDESELRLSLLAHLQPSNDEPRRILLLVDEADALPPRLLEELRALTSLSANGQMQVNLVLAGSSTLEEQFADPKLELFSQRLSARCYLSAFGREETFQYVRAQVAVAGHEPEELFTDDAFEAVFAATDGVPRLVNQLGDQLMWMVSETGCAPLDGPIVQQAWSELQQLPAPWNTQAKETVGGEVEFGDLAADEIVVDEVVFEDDGYTVDYEDELDDLPASIPMSLPTDELPVDTHTGTETLDITEELIDRLQEMDEPKPEVVSEPPIGPQAVASTTSNPFAEEFESEEIVLDRYSTFESLLLAEAPRVLNQSDTSFSQQLQQFETFETPLPQIQPLSSEQISESAELLLETPGNASPAQPSVEPSVDLNDILVIEDSEPGEAEVVSGQKFRQLFSSLEQANSASCFG